MAAGPLEGGALLPHVGWRRTAGPLARGHNAANPRANRQRIRAWHQPCMAPAEPGVRGPVIPRGKEPP